tara:strand:- start:4180 stop:4767 length:588 start_codon:yes stop_codon:yes gene_type:complete
MTIGDLGTDYIKYEPTVCYAGTTWKWKIDNSDYPADQWTLVYYFRENKGQYSFDITATADDKTHVVTYAKTDTDDIAPGIYAGQGFVSKGSERFIIYDGTLEVLPDFNLQKTGQDLRSHSEKVLEQIKALLEGRFVSDDASYSIAGRSLTKLSPQELIEAKDYYQKRVVTELRKNRARQGLHTGQTIRNYFKSGF